MKRSLYLTLIIGFLNLSVISVYSSGLQPPQKPPGVVPVFEQEYPGLWQFYQDSTLLTARSSNLKRVEKLDSTQQHVRIHEYLFDKDYRLPASMNLEYYVQHRLQFDNRMLWRKTTLTNLSQRQTSDGKGIELNIPVKIKSEAFQRIFGGDQVGLRVTGNISFELAGRKENREGSAVSSFEQRGNFSPRFKQTQQFQVEGRVGDKVSVKVDQNSEATFDFENTLRLTYTGNEDEIVQSIEAGNVSLNLPGTNYVSASSKHQGLFGLKTSMQMGNLSFIGIASLQRGEKQKLTKTGGQDENTFRIKDYEYMRDRFFFVDSIYAANFESSYNPQNMTWEVFGGGAYEITQLDVWIKDQPTEDTRPGWAAVNPDDPDLVPDPNNLESLEGKDKPGELEFSYFRRLRYPEDYGYDEYRGYFWLRQNVDENDIVAVAYETAGGDKKGKLYNELSDSATVLLKMVRPSGAKPDYEATWELAMKNVYNLGASQISAEGFDVNVLYTKTGTDEDVQPVGDPKSFISLMGLDRLNEQGGFQEGGDKKVDVNNGNIFDLTNGYLIFPSTTPFSPPSNSPFKIDSSLNVNIYDVKDRTIELQEHKFSIEVTTTSQSSTFNLGFNVLEGSEVVRLNGRTLEKDKDYTIDYFGGTLQILAPEARRADANVEIEYERGSLFQLDKKTLLGGRLEYSFGDRGFIGMTGLYLNKTTLDQRVRLGQEPVRNLIWDINGAFDFQPNFITKALDFLPLVETSADSRLRLEAEIAQVSPNPNTFNEEDLGEKSGVAYIDDFEGSERTTPLGVVYRGWSPASVPARFRIPEENIDFDVPISDDSLMYQMDDSRVRMFWYNPYNQVPINDIWPNKDVNAQTGTTTNVLNLRWRNPEIPDSIAWAGIMRSTANFPDQNKTKFIELWVQGRTGQVNIDLGRISEDYYIRDNTFTFNGRKSLRNLNTEDINLNGLLDEGEDIGLDGIPNGQPNDDPRDNWEGPDQNKGLLAFLNINGTEGNGTAKGAKYPDTEDLDGDGGLSLTNEYFTYSFDLEEKIHPYIKGRTVNPDRGTEWRLYRIPIRNFNPDFVVGQPDTNFREVYFVRLWINDLPQDDTLRTIQIATFDFVGNEWEERGVALTEDSPFVRDDSLFSIAAYNTEENVEEVPGGPEAYHTPPNVSGIKDRVTKAISKEQSLVLQLGNLEPGARAEATKQLYEKLNFINYGKLKMFVHGDRDLPMQDSPLEFYMRFGPAEGIYYEVGGQVFPHWDERNYLDCVLDDLAKTKQVEYKIGDTNDGKPIYYRQVPGDQNRYFKVVGEPNLRNINFLVIGARNVSELPIENKEIWLDELRVTDVERAKGTAMRLMTDMRLADVANFRAQWEVVDSDFRRIEDQFGSGNTTEKQNYRFGVKLDKFLPSSWGFSIPISGGYVRSKNIPKYFYNSDQLTNYKSDGFLEKLNQFFGFNELNPELEKNSRISENTSLGATIRRNSSPRAPWYLKYTVDMLTLDMDWNERHSSDPRNLLNDSESISGRLQLQVPFGSNNSFKPFSWLGNGPIVRKLANQQIFYTPSSMSMSLSVNDNESVRQARLETESTRTINTTASRQISLGYKLFPSLNLNFSRDYRSDAQLKGYRAADLVESIFTKFDFGVDKVMNQTFSGSYNPNFFDWMSQSFRYNASFNYNFQNIETNQKSSRLAVSKQFNVNLKPTVLANKIYNPEKAKLERRRQQSNSRRTGGPRRGNRTQEKPPSPKQSRDEKSPETELLQEQEQEQEGQRQDKQEEGEQSQQQDGEAQQGESVLSKVPNPAILLWKIFDSWKNISVDYRITDNYSHFNIDGMPNLGHQFGFNSDPGVGTDTTFKKQTILPSIQHGENVSASMSFDIIKNLTTSLKYNYAKNENQNNQRKTETVSSTYFFSGDDPEANKKPWHEFVPDWQLRLTGVENWFFFSKYAKSIQLEHARNGKFNENLQYDEEGKTRTGWGYSNNYSPLLGINVRTVWGIGGNIRYTKSSTFNFDFSGSDRKNVRSSLDMTLSFTKTGGFSLPLPFLKNKKLKNEMQFNFSMNHTSDLNFAKRPNSSSDEFVEQAKNSTFKFRPSVTYRFSQKVNGSTFFEYSSSENKRTGKYSYFEFGIKVNIAIR